jgi:hypothetical protein
MCRWINDYKVYFKHVSDIAFRISLVDSSEGVSISNYPVDSFMSMQLMRAQWNAKSVMSGKMGISNISDWYLT